MLSPGAPKSVRYEFAKQTEADDCSVHIALARPWLFSGFNDDGTLVDETTAIKYFVIPITTDWVEKSSAPTSQVQVIIKYITLFIQN